MIMIKRVSSRVVNTSVYNTEISDIPSILVNPKHYVDEIALFEPNEVTPLPSYSKIGKIGSMELYYPAGTILNCQA
jgi:hypothetical protein